MKCADHPKIDTNLKCGKCGKPICPKCMVDTPVGTRCRECAALSKVPTFEVSAKHKAQAVAAGAGAGVVLGILWGFVAQTFSLLYVNLLIAALVGYAASEVISHVTNRKRGNALSVIAGLSVVIAYGVSMLLPWGNLFEGMDALSIILDIVAVGLGVFIAVGRLR